MEFKQFLTENWEYIAAGLGLGGAGFGGQKAYKAMQKSKDKGQDSRIRKNASDITTLKNDMVEVKAKQKTMVLALEQNTKDDLDFRDRIQKIVEDTNISLADFKTKFFSLREGDQSRKIERLEKQIDKLTK